MGSRDARPAGLKQVSSGINPARSPGPTGHNDSADFGRPSQPGDTPSPLGVNDHSRPTTDNRVELEQSVNKAAADLDKELTAIEQELAMEIAKTAVDLAGLVDPTPISDAIGAGLSLRDGDLLGAGLSVLSMVPYAGDVVGKPVKAARSAKKIAALKDKAKKIGEAIKERLGKSKPKEVQGPKEAGPYSTYYLDSPYKDKSRPPEVIQKELTDQIEKDMAEALEKGGEKIAKANREIQSIHDNYVKTGNWKFDGLDDMSVPDDALKALRAAEKAKAGK